MGVSNTFQVKLIKMRNPSLPDMYSEQLHLALVSALLALNHSSIFQCALAIWDAVMLCSLFLMSHVPRSQEMQSYFLGIYLK